MEHIADTICAPATSTGTSAISVIRVSGDKALSITDRIITFRNGDSSSSEGYRIKFGTVRGGIDDVLVSIFRAPHSYTGEDGVEISCHASPYIVKRILELLVEEGARNAGPGEFTQRAFVNGKLDLAQAEAVVDLISSRSEASHRVAMNQLRGAYSSELRTLRDKLLELTALMELELDFSEEDVEFADRSQLKSLLEEALLHIGKLVDSFRTGNAIRNGVPVAIVGAVNSGKSTLLNALLGEERAIVSNIAGTTRDTIEETLMLGGILFRFIDTAGLRATDDEIEKYGIERTLKMIEKAEIVIELTDASASGDIESVSVSPDRKLIRVSNKTDLSPALPGTIGISALTGSGLDELKSRIVESVRGRFDGSETLVTNVRHFEALTRARDSLISVRNGLGLGVPTDLVSEDLRSAVNELNCIFGDSGGIDFKAVTDVIFSRFCIGK